MKIGGILEIDKNFNSAEEFILNMKPFESIENLRSFKYIQNGNKSNQFYLLSNLCT